MARCYDCHWRREVPGDAHSRCGHPLVPEPDGLIALAAVIGSRCRAGPLQIDGLTVEGDPHGIRRGWFFWPYNYDPVWLRSCDGFKQKNA